MVEGMKHERDCQPSIDVENILDCSIGELLRVNYDLLRYRVLAHFRALKMKERLLESRLREVSGETDVPLGKDYASDLTRKLEDVRRDLEVLGKISSKIGILGTIRIIEKELRDVNSELWSEIERVKLRDLLGFEGDPGDKLAVYNHLLGILRGPAAGMAHAKQAVQPAEVPAGKEQPAGPEPMAPGFVNVSEKDYVSMSVGEWVNLLNSCFENDKHLELPDNYLAENMRRPLRNLIAAMLELPPEKLRRVIPKKYKYLLVLHGILYTILREDGEYVTTPGSSDREYIEGEGGIFGIFQADLLSEETTDNTRKKVYRVRIGGQEYEIVKEVILENGRAKQIKYVSRSQMLTKR